MGLALQIFPPIVCEEEHQFSEIVILSFFTAVFLICCPANHLSISSRAENALVLYSVSIVKILCV